jgi:hypothetical protein
MFEVLNKNGDEVPHDLLLRMLASDVSERLAAEPIDEAAEPINEAAAIA